VGVVVVKRCSVSAVVEEDNDVVLRIDDKEDTLGMDGMDDEIDDERGLPGVVSACFVLDGVGDTDRVRKIGGVGMLDFDTDSLAVETLSQAVLVNDVATGSFSSNFDVTEVEILDLRTEARLNVSVLVARCLASEPNETIFSFWEEENSRKEDAADSGRDLRRCRKDDSVVVSGDGDDSTISGEDERSRLATLCLGSLDSCCLSFGESSSLNESLFCRISLIERRGFIVQRGLCGCCSSFSIGSFVGDSELLFDEVYNLRFSMLGIESAEQRCLLFDPVVVSDFVSISSIISSWASRSTRLEFEQSSGIVVVSILSRRMAGQWCGGSGDLVEARSKTKSLMSCCSEYVSF